MNKSVWPLILMTTFFQTFGQKKNVDRQYPIIDMHLHSEWWNQPGMVAWNRTEYKANRDQKSHSDSTFWYLKKYNIVKAVTDGPYALDYLKREPELIIPARYGYLEPIDSLRKWFMNGTYKVMAEFMPQYEGVKPNDEEIDKYFSLAEELNIPVGIHMGLGPPGAVYSGTPKYRMSYSNPLLLEDALVKHPKLRIYIMHAGWPFIDELIGLLYAYPQVYVDIAVINWFIPTKEFYGYLKRIIDAGYSDRIMYGSDEMMWPQSIKTSIETIKSADFLTAKQKDDIFYNNAAKFLKLTDQEIKKHKGH